MPKLIQALDAQTNVQAKILEQSQLQFLSKDNKKVPEAIRYAHLNASSTDGVHPATYLTAADKEYMGTRNALECKEQVEKK